MATTIQDVRDLLEDAGVDVENGLGDLSDVDLNYAQHDGVSQFKSFLYTHQIPELIRTSVLDPDMWGMAYIFTGPSGIGKTDVIRQGFNEAAAAMGRPADLTEIHLSQMVITDVTGIPRPNDKEQTTWYRPDLYPLVKVTPQHQVAAQQLRREYQQSGHADWSIMRDPETGEPFPLRGLFYDEATNPSSPAVAHQCFSLWYGNFIGRDRLVDDTFHVLAGNRVEDQTNSINLSRSACSRLNIIPVVPSLAGWIFNWAMKSVTIAGREITREHPAVISFLHNNSRLFAPSAVEYAAMSAYPNPRCWSFLSRVLHKHDRDPMPQELLQARIAGYIGDEAANIFDKYLKYWRELVDVRKLLNSPAKGDGPFGWLPAKWPSAMDIRTMIGLQMVTMVDASNAKRFLAFMCDEQKFSPEMRVLFVKLLKEAGHMTKLSREWAPKEFREWSAMHRHFILGADH